MIVTKENPLLALDVYKMGHMEQYVPGCNKVFSYLLARSDRNYDNTVFFGLQYYLEEYFKTKLTKKMGEEFLQHREYILGIKNSKEIEEKIMALCELGYFPLRIKAVPEGAVMPVKNVLMTMTNTLDEFHWVVGFVESLILKVWYPITVASCAHKYRDMVDTAFEHTVEEEQAAIAAPFTVHDFGYRGDSTEEGAGLSGAAVLLSTNGSDTVPALKFAMKYYDAEPDKGLIMASIPASEHSVMCSFGRGNEFQAFENMLDLYPSGFVSIVSDTFDVYHVLTDFARRLKDRIEARDGKVVFRPDSGNPEHIICGNPEAAPGSPEWKGAIRLLDEVFGSKMNSWGYRVLNPKVGLIYGDGMYMERYQRTLDRLKEMGYAPSNLVIGVGGILRNHSRDTLGFALKATHVEVNGESREIEKDPITDHKKKSHKGLITLVRDAEGYKTIDQCTDEQEASGLLQTVFEDGKILHRYKFEDIRTLAQKEVLI